MHSLFVGERLACKGLIVNDDNLVTSNDTCALGRTITDNLLDVEGILADGELNAHTRERTTQVVVGLLHVLG